jgi:hypothetical protein
MMVTWLLSVGKAGVIVISCAPSGIAHTTAVITDNKYLRQENVLQLFRCI